MEQEKTPSKAPAEAPSPIVQEDELPLYLKDDETGKPRYMLNWTVKEFMELLDQAQGQKLPDETPPYSIQSISVTGAAAGEARHVELSISFKIRVRDETWTRVPLRLDQAVLVPGDGESRVLGERFLDFDPGGQGYVVWLRGAAGQEHELTLPVWVPLITVGDETRLRLSMPRAARSSLKLTVPLAEAAGKVSDGATLTGSSPSESGGTQFDVAGLNGEFELAWRPAQDLRPQVGPLLEAEGTIVAQVDRCSVTTVATLTVTPHGGPFDRFAVRLPKGAQLIHDIQSGYSVSERAGADGDAEEIVADVQRAELSLAPMEVQLSARESRGATAPAGSFELGGFEVIDTDLQSGYVAVTAVRDQHVWCVPGRGVRRIETLPEKLQEGLQDENVVARFQYFSQPFSIAARIVEIKTSVRVEPEYRILVGDRQMKLNAKLKYTVRGGDVPAFYVGMAGWEVDRDEVGPDTVVNPGGVAVDRSEMLSIPLRQPTTGTVEIAIAAHRRVESESGSLSFRLPQPQDDSLRLAEVVIQPADNVMLVPDTTSDGIKGLVRQQVPPPPPPETGLASWQQTPLYYRTDAANVQFAGSFEVFAQEVTVDLTGEVSLGEGQARVVQTLAYGISHESLDVLSIRVPRSLAESDRLEVSVDGQSMAIALDPREAANGSGCVRGQIVLPTARIGKLALEVRYRVDVPGASSQATSECRVPLVMPDDADGLVELLSNELHVTAPGAVTVRPLRGLWRASRPLAERERQRPGWWFSADGRTAEIVLGIQQEDRSATVVERAWVQTCLTPAGRRDRAVFEFTSDQKELELALPPGTDYGGLQAFVGGEDVDMRQRVQTRGSFERGLVVPLPEDPNSRRQWLEVRYDVSGVPLGPGLLLMELPGIGADVRVRHTRWQLVLPRNQHVIGAPQGLTPEFTWGWNGAFWARLPILEQPQLESWSGGARLTPVPEGTSRYLFSSLGPVARVEVRTAGRWLIVLGASLAVLTAGLLLIYVPALRHPAGLFAAAVLLLGATLIYPEQALLALEAASLGLVLTLVAGMLHRALARDRHWVVRPEVSSSVLHKGSTQAQYRPPAAGSQTSTDAAPTPVSTPSPGSNP